MLSFWQNDNHHDWSARLAAQQSLPVPNRPARRNPAPSVSSVAATRSSGSVVSASSSAMASSRAPSNCTPSLTSDHWSISSPSSVSTGVASGVLAAQELLEPDSEGVLERVPVFECPFWFLGCKQRFQDDTEWRNHSLVHFHPSKPPRSVECPLCKKFHFESDDGDRSWKARMDHVAEHHRQGQTLENSDADYHLFDHLWRIKVIDNHQLKELKGNFAMTRPPRHEPTPAGLTRAERLRPVARTYFN